MSIKPIFPSVLIVLAILVMSPSISFAQSGGLGLHPGRAEMQIKPGAEKTVSFRIESPAAEHPVRGRLVLTLTDWIINSDTSVSYAEPGTLPQSASQWTTFSPAAVSIESGQSQLVRVTARVPENTPPGVYRTGIFVQERPSATPPQPGERVVMFRFRYLFSLYIIVGPVTGRGEFVDLRMNTEGKALEVISEFRNSGSRHVRPYVDWIIRDSAGAVVASLKQYEGTVLLPHATNFERVTLTDLPPDLYEIEARVDFQDGHPIQAVKAPFEVLAPATQ